MLIIEDLKEYVFAIFFGEETEKDMVSRDSLKFLGTAFFVSKRGVMSGTKCIGFMTGNVTSEKLLARSEEISEICNSVEKITLVESKEVLHYGVFRPFSIYKDHKSEIFSNMDLPELIDERNKP